MIRKAQEVQYFFYSQPLADGVRASVAILLPAITGYFFDFFETGLAISLGAMCVSLTDAPGPYIHKKNGMLFASLFIFLVALITSFARLNIYLMALEIGLVCFFFSMFNVYGNRAGSVGSAAILIMIIRMDRPLATIDAFIHAGQILGGGLFYTALSLLLYKLRPYLFAQRALADSIREMANYLSIKADFYNPQTDLDLDYRRMVAEQVAVHEKQEAVRELLFKTRQIVTETTAIGRKLVLTFVETVDLFEKITATYLDYDQLRKQYEGSGILEQFSLLLKKMANELDHLGMAIQLNQPFRKTLDYDQEIIELKEAIDALSHTGIRTQPLKRVLVNIRSLLGSFNRVDQYFYKENEKRSETDHSRFISHQSLNPKIYFDNLSLQSSVFRHAIRVAISCLAGFIIAKFIDYGHHSYWILLTVAFILKPAFSLTRERNIQRIIGTVAGGLLGVFIFVFIPNDSAQFFIMVVFMIGTYTFMRLNYLVMVFCTTPYILILFKFLNLGFINLAGERILDTAIGCILALAASYFLFPTWEATQLKNYIQNMLEANIKYLSKILDALYGQNISNIEYKLVRKEVYVASANLSAAFQRMLSEPKSKQQSVKYLHQFVVFNHLLFSNVAHLSASLQSMKTEPSSEQRAPAKRALKRLKNAQALVEGKDKKILQELPAGVQLKESSADQKLVKEQLEFIDKISADIEKATAKILNIPVLKN